MTSTTLTGDNSSYVGTNGISIWNNVWNHGNLVNGVKLYTECDV